MFTYDVKSGFPNSSFASFGPIFMKKLFNFPAISFLSVICFSFEMSWEFILDFGFAHYISNSFPCFFNIIFRFIEFQVVIFSLGFPL